ncbi:leucyl aminopeptidase [Roseiarcus fermentans]|uniref:Leucyl aminopeptidase n=1 Tax=Roseiarcus fermentans TaxID=1473586 RepID=A0A366ERK6_9HYPH|nr:leucyl aminopeptidase [Roseiarcus fermentans]
MPRFAAPTPSAVPVWLAAPGAWDAIQASIGATAAAFAQACGFKAKPGQIQLLPGEDGRLAGALFGVEAEGVGRDPLAAGKLATSLPEGVYRFANPPADAALAALGFLMALYRYDRFKADAAGKPRLVAPEGVDADRIERIAEAVAFGRDLVNAPANVLGPGALEQAATRLADDFGAEARVTRGDDLMAANFPLVHAVGRAAAEAPRVVDIAWGRRDAPKVTLVGKGVTFDSGGLDIKPASGMELMKKDMGGAATALALARLVMESGLDVRLRVVTPIVENAVAGGAMRPGDVIVSRKGLAVEIGNTDAEGRLILADALALADEDAPDLMIDFATLTGAARVALGPDLPPFYTDDDALAAAIADAAARARDPMWRMPLWRPYEAMIDGTVGDVSNSGTGAGMAGSITAALFLRRFVDKAKAWVHFDVYAWNPKARAHGPAGGEIQAARALFELLSERYPKR